MSVTDSPGSSNHATPVVHNQVNFPGGRHMIDQLIKIMKPAFKIVLVLGIGRSVGKTTSHMFWIDNTHALR